MTQRLRLHRMWSLPAAGEGSREELGPPSSSFARSGDPGSDLANIADADALFRWALEILPARNKLDDAQRAAFDAAFLARADAIGADPELLIPFTSRRAPSPLGDGPVLPTT